MIEEGKLDLLNIDIITGSDLIFNNLGLKSFPNFLGNIVKIFEKNGKKIPLVYFAHKARNDEIDDQLVPIFEGLGFYGDQMEDKDMNSDWMSRRVDIIRLEHGIID